MRTVIVFLVILSVCAFAQRTPAPSAIQAVGDGTQTNGDVKNTERESVIAALKLLFGQPSEAKTNTFRISRDMQLIPSFSVEGVLTEFSIVPRDPVEPYHLNRQAMELSHQEFENLVGKLSSIKAIGELVEDSGFGIVLSFRTSQTKLFQYAYLSTTEALSEGNPRPVQSATISYLHSVTGVASMSKLSGPVSAEDQDITSFGAVCVDGREYAAPKSEFKKILLNSGQRQTLNLAGPMGELGCSDIHLPPFPLQCGSPPMPTRPPEPMLEDLHIALTKEALIAALRSKDEGVRGVAADALAAHWPDAAAPAVEEALRREADAMNYVRLAFVLAKLGKPNELSHACHNPREWGSTRMEAAMRMCELRSDACVDSALNILEHDNDPNDPMAKVKALELVPSFIGHLSSQESNRVLELIMKALDESGSCTTASQVLNGLGYVAAIPRIEAAIARHQDADLRAQMEGDLRWLKEANKKHCTHGLSTDGACVNTTDDGSALEGGGTSEMHPR